VRDLLHGKCIHFVSTPCNRNAHFWRWACRGRQTGPGVLASLETLYVRFRTDEQRYCRLRTSTVLSRLQLPRYPREEHTLLVCRGTVPYTSSDSFHGRHFLDVCTWSKDYLTTTSFDRSRNFAISVDSLVLSPNKDYERMTVSSGRPLCSMNSTSDMIRSGALPLKTFQVAESYVLLSTIRCPPWARTTATSQLKESHTLHPPKSHLQDRRWGPSQVERPFLGCSNLWGFAGLPFTIGYLYVSSPSSGLRDPYLPSGLPHVPILSSGWKSDTLAFRSSWVPPPPIIERNAK